MLKKRKSIYCPVCKKSENDYGYLKDMKYHISSSARGELFRNALTGYNQPTPHMDYVKKNAVVVDKTDFVII